MIRLGSWLILLEAATIGATSALLPLRLSRFGAPSVVIGAVFLVASLMSMSVAGPIGRTVDRRGAAAPLCVGLFLTAILMALLPLPAQRGAAGDRQRDRARRPADRVHDPLADRHHRRLRAALASRSQWPR